MDKNQLSVPRQYRFIDLVTASFVAVLLISNIASTKLISFGQLNLGGSTPFDLVLDGGTLLFPLAYIFGDILTEVYGYKRSRRVIWTGFFWMFLATLFFYIVQIMPSSQGWTGAVGDSQAMQNSYESIIGQIPRFAVASLIAYLVGEFSNSFVLAKLKVQTNGRYLWLRTISSTLVGEGIDTVVFTLIAFWGLPSEVLISILALNYIYKVGVEVCFTPITYAIVNFLKRAEDEDYYDRKTNFNPFAFADR